MYTNRNHDSRKSTDRYSAVQDWHRRSRPTTSLIVLFLALGVGMALRKAKPEAGEGPSSPTVLESYRSAANPQEALAKITRERFATWLTEPDKDLSELADLHRQNHPDDPWLAIVDALIARHQSSDRRASNAMMILALFGIPGEERKELLDHLIAHDPSLAVFGKEQVFGKE